jgi:hypothetical protein
MSIEKEFNKALKKWMLYDNKVCHEIQRLIKDTDFDHINFYEFAKGYVFAALELQEENKLLREAARQAEEYTDCNNDECFAAHIMKNALAKLNKERGSASNNS